MKRTAIFVAVGVVLVAGAAGAYVKHRHHAHVKHHARHLLAHAKPAQLKHHAGHRLALVKHHPNNHLRRVVYRETAPLNCLPPELRAKVVEIVDTCGSHIIRTFTPGAIIAGTSHLSEHAFCRAADLAGNPGCIYAHLRHFRGGYSIDYGRMQHVHVSWHPGGWEQGVRFVHGGGFHTPHTIAFAGR